MSFFTRQLSHNFNKEYFDFDAPVIGIHDFHPQLRIVLALNGLFFNNRSSKLRFLLPLILTILSILGVTFEGLAIYHALSTGDTATFTEAVAYMVIIGVVPFLYFCIFSKSDNIYALIASMDNDFRSICLTGEPYRKAFLAGQLTIWRCGFAWLIFVIFVASMYVLLSVLAIMYHCLIIEHTEDSSRPFIFPLWLPNGDPTRTPNYEMFMLYMYFVIMDFVLTFTTYVYVVFHLLLHCYFLINMVVIGLENLFRDLDENVVVHDQTDDRYLETRALLKERMGKIVSWHGAVFNLVSNTLEVYGAVLAYQVIFSSIVLCLMAFNISVQIEQGTFDICITLLAVGALLQLWIPCYLGSLLRHKGYQIGDAAFYSGWHHSTLGMMVKTDLQLTILRSQRPITIQVTPLPVLCLETFSSILSTAYSYFNMLRQTSE